MLKKMIIQEAAVTSEPFIIKKNEAVLEFTAVLQDCGVPNRNGRVYPKAVLERGIAAPYIQERLRTKSLFSECGHPFDPSIQRQMTIVSSNAVCLIKELWFEGNLLKGKLETLNTSMGRDFKGLIEQGSIVGFSLRAQGNVVNDPTNNTVIVQDPIQICTWDYVVNPSHSVAWLERVCEETYNSLIKPEKYENRVMALCEATNLFENGSLILLDEKAESFLDYTKFANKKIKTLNETFFYENTDKLSKINEDGTAVIEGEFKTKKVMLEDFMLKDIRNQILKISPKTFLEELELGQAAAEPVATEDKEPEEVSLEVEREDILGDEIEAEEVQEVEIE